MSDIQSNIFREEGTALVFKTNPTIGLLTLTGFTDDATPNQPPDREFIKTFRYSVNGAIYSEWQDLSIENIVRIQLPAKAVFVAELNYRKVQAPDDDYLDVNEVTIQATEDTSQVFGRFYFTGTLFSKYFDINDPDALNWYINVLEKIYKKGLIANYLDRLDDFGSPDDFIALWASISHFFSYYVKLARTFARFYENETLLREFLEQRGLNVSPEDTLSQLQTMLESYYYQMSLRGTDNINTIGNGTDIIDGELLRLIHYQRDVDEFLFCLYRKHHFGWNLGNSSPLYRGLRINDLLNKAPWSLRYVSVENIDNTYSNGTVITDGTVNDKVLSLANAGYLTFTGINAIKVDPHLDYQISFKIKLAPGAKFDFELVGYNNNGNVINFTSRTDGDISNVIFNQVELSRTDRYLTVKCYMFNSSRGNLATDMPNIHQGQNLIANAALAKLGLRLEISGGTARVYDFRILPMLTSYSRGFIQVNNFISIWLRNRNSIYNTEQLTDYIRKYLIPYNCHLKITEITTQTYGDITDNPVETFYWVGAGEYCRKVVWIGTDPACENGEFIWIPEDETAYCEQK